MHHDRVSGPISAVPRRMVDVDNSKQVVRTHQLPLHVPDQVRKIEEREVPVLDDCSDRLGILRRGVLNSRYELTAEWIRCARSGHPRDRCSHELACVGDDGKVEAGDRNLAARFWCRDVSGRSHRKVTIESRSSVWLSFHRIATVIVEVSDWEPL